MIKSKLSNIPQLVLLRSDKILYMLIDSLIGEKVLLEDSILEIFEGTRDFYPNNFRLDEIELSISQNEIKNSGIESDYNYENFIGRDYDYSFIDTVYDKFYTQNGTNIYVKCEEIENYLSFINKVSPFCIMGYRLSQEFTRYKLGFEDIIMHIEEYTPLGLLVDKNKEYADNHIHLKGSGYLSFNFAKLISYKTPSIYYNKKFLKEIPRINEFSYINNHNLSIGQLVDILKFCKDIFYNLAMFGEESVLDNIANYNIKLQKIVSINKNIGIKRGLSIDTISKLYEMIYISGSTTEHKFLKKIVNYHNKNEYSKACMLESVLMFYLYQKSKSIYIKRIIKISIHIINILRSYMVMSQNIGLAHFSEFSGSAIREAEKRNAHNSATSIINSGTTHVNAKISTSKNSYEISKNLIDFIYAFDSKNSDIKFNFGLCVVKNREKDDIEQNELLKPKYFKKRLELKKRTLAIDDFIRNVRYKSISRYHTMLQSNPKYAYRLKNRLKNSYYDLSKYIVSIDAVGKETHTPPEVFAPHFRYLRRVSKRIKNNIFLGTLNIKYHKNLAFTIHAGEDFNHIVTGMRRVDESIKFFEMQTGDRLGHMLSIGITPKEWLSNTQEIILHKGDYFDDLVWLTMKLKEIPLIDNINLSHHINIYTDKVYELFREIYPVYSGEKPHISDFYRAWLYRKNCPVTYYKRERGETMCGEYEQIVLDQKRPTPIVKQLYELYQSNAEVRRHYKESYLIKKDDIKDAELTVWEILQDYMINEIAKLGIVIESNPSSNIFISKFDSYITHPIFRFNPPKDIFLQKGEKFNKYGLREGKVGVTINSDDPAIFVTSLQNEYRAIKRVAKEIYNCTDKEAEEWIEDIREFGLRVFNKLYF